MGKVVKRIATSIVLATATNAGLGEVVNNTAGINALPETPALYANGIVFGLNCKNPTAEQTAAGETAQVIGSITVTDTLPGASRSLRDIKLPGTNYQVSWMLLAGPEGATLNGLPVEAGQTLLYDGQEIKTKPFTSEDPKARGESVHDITRDVISLHANGAKFIVASMQTPEEKKGIRSKYVNLDCKTPKTETPNTPNTPPAKTPTPINPETPAQGTPTPTEVCPATEPEKIGFIDIPARVTEGKTFPGNWSVKNTGPLDLGKPDVKISLPSGLSVKAIPANMKLVRGNTLVLKKDILGTSWALDMNETKAGRIMLMANKVKVNTRATVRLRSEAKTVVVKANGQPCDSTATKARDSTIIINLPDVPVVGGFTG